MTNSLLFEGSDLEDVLSEAQLVFGPDVEIVQANRVRKGGMFGFFAKEWFEVWAHGPTSPTSSMSTASPALTMLERETADADIDTFQSMVTNALAEQNEVDGFDSAMSRFFGTASADDGAAGAGTAPSARQARPVTPVVSNPSGGADISAMTTAVIDAPVVEQPTFARAVAPAHDDTPSPTPVVPVTSAAVALEDAPRGASIFDEPRQARTDLLWAVLERIETATEIPAMPTQGVVAFVGDASMSLPLVQELGQRLGLWGNEVAVVTPYVHDDIPTWLAIDDLTDLASRAPRWRRREGAVPVIIDDSIDRPNLDWVGESLEALSPAQTRLIAEAWRLPEQVGRIALRMGGIDAIDLAQAGDTIDPLAMLDLDIPIGSVEGRPASAELLAAIWLDRKRRA
ncbi:MAG: hypothetical protein AAGC53_02745 [Actinomycetota bacterium]